MNKYLNIIIACSLFFSCGSGHDNPKQEPEPEEPVEVPYEMPCSCMDEWISQEETTCQRELPWDFPVKPGTEEWDQFQTHEEIVNARQIPEDILVSLSTDDLTTLCMEYILYASVFIFDHVDDGLDALFDEFNGVRELFQRTDVVNGLLKWYRCTMKELSDETISVEREAQLWNTVYNWEALVSRCQLHEQKEYIKILQHLVCGYEKHVFYRWDDLDSQSFISPRSNFFSRTRIITKIDEKILEESLKEISHTSRLSIFYYGIVYENSMRIINELTCRFIQ